MGAVNRVPRGLLGLLDAKTQGRTPADSAGVLSPTIDLTPNYLADIPFGVAQAASLSNTTGVNLGIITVPDGTLWYVYVVSSEGIATAAGDLNTIPVVVAPSGVISLPLKGTLKGLGALAIGESNVEVATFQTPLLAAPGTQFASRIVNTGGGNINCVTSVLFRAVTV